MMNAIAFLEVMDKEPALLQVWLTFLIIGVGGFCLGRYRRWLLFIVMPIALSLAWVHFSELHDPFVGHHVLREAGRHYFTQSYVAMVFAIALPLLSLFPRLHSFKKSTAW